MEQGKPLHDTYDDFSIRHPAMPLSRRAKIFNPFDALKGFDDAIAAKNIRYTRKRELSEDEICLLERKLNLLHRLTQGKLTDKEESVTISVTWFSPASTAQSVPDYSDTEDECSEPLYGIYKTTTGTFHAADGKRRKLILEHIEIPFDDIIEIECERFDFDL